ncbi:hypothetical protein NPIL_122021 [Nephila pilipes]|uniref:Uncharacterized protein n=1 Tax=Nephila pilipes TaxID=299642 RepID=A0A8X6MS41_NEPPI|nr:hypothetical protein NPIL_122021 [Nephila pilipes]
MENYFRYFFSFTESLRCRFCKRNSHLRVGFKILVEMNHWKMWAAVGDFELPERKEWSSKRNIYSDPTDECPSTSSHRSGDLSRIHPLISAR